MVIIIRRVGAPKWWDVCSLGTCLIGFGEVVGMFPSSTPRVIWLESDDE